MGAEAANGTAVDAAATMRRSVKQLHFGVWEEKGTAAAEIKRLAGANPSMKRRLAELGVIPPLVSMLVEVPDDGCRRLAVEALIELAKGTSTNKARMVEAGLLANLPQMMGHQDFSRKQELALLLFSISSLAKTQFPIAPCHILPCLVSTLSAQGIADEVKVTCLGTLYNLSTKLDNTKAIVSSGAVHALLTLLPNKGTSEGALSTLSNLVLSTTGKKAIEDDPMVPKAFMEAMARNDNAKCQELAAYVIMVLAHRSRTQRQRMAGLQIVPLLLEVALLGSPIAQQRALKIMQRFKHEGQARTGAHSEPQVERVLRSASSIGKGETEECRKAIKKIVKQSLDKNMELITRRAHASGDFSCSKNLVFSSSSKSLPN